MKRYLNKDWCTMFPDKVGSANLSEICYRHDMRYTDKSKSRWTADLELFNDVKHESNIFLASAMFLGVRTVGWLFYYK